MPKLIKGEEVEKTTYKDFIRYVKKKYPKASEVYLRSWMKVIFTELANFITENPSVNIPELGHFVWRPQTTLNARNPSKNVPLNGDKRSFAVVKFIPTSWIKKTIKKNKYEDRS